MAGQATTETQLGSAHVTATGSVDGTVQVAPDGTITTVERPAHPTGADPQEGHSGGGGQAPGGEQPPGQPDAQHPHPIQAPEHPPAVPRNPGEHPGDPQPGRPRHPEPQHPGDGKPGVAPGEPDPSGGGKNRPPRDTDGPTATDKHYWTVELKPPAGAKPAVRAIVSMARTAIQTAVDLLGRGMPVPPPKVGDLLKPVVFGYLGKSDSTKGYQQAIAAVNARQSSLLTYDHQIAQTSIIVAANQDETLGSIKKIVGDLQTWLEGVPAKLTPKQEVVVMSRIGAVVDKVYQLVAAVYADNESHAGNNGGTSGSGGSGSGGSSGSGSGAGGATAGNAGAAAGGGGIGDVIGQLLPMAAMILPMGAMALTPVITQMMQKNEHDKQEQELQSNGQITPEGGAAPLPAAAPNAVAPTAVPNMNPSSVDPATGAQNAGAAGAAPATTNAPKALAPNTTPAPGSLPPVKAAPRTASTDRTKTPDAPVDAETPEEQQEGDAAASTA
ncbi:hypothetical protein NONO_c16080 [Nocardia nova SH22a]|uniref:Uncharacterized protein n=1 Tax=Nocardia nova SH22a TaxID=1415166 RepID=W5TBA6_9NOCA|nr:hypothetical protein [Nocardia nova]AHH16409.1 hypothetical protein NONO_c16080 [Nocardia nova SH22a]